jgi:hypothetical protein
MVKDRGRAESWNVYHSILGATKYLVLNTTAAEEDNVNRWNDTEPTTSTIGLGTNDNTNGSSTYVCYAWHNVEGYTKFSTYIGNGNANGPTIWLGFLPKMVWIKRYDSTGDWNVYRWDTSSVNAGYIDLPVNPIEARLELNTGNSRDTGEPIDFLATGIKIKDDDGHINTSGGKYIVCAWGNKSFTYNSIL